MRLIDSSDPGTLELESRNHGRAALIGLPMIIAGAGLIAAAAGAAPFGLRLPPELPPQLIAVVGGFQALLGLFLTGSRSGLRVSRVEQAVVHWYGIFVPLHSRTRSLEGLHRVSLSTERSGGNNQHTTFPVRLVGTTAGIDLASSRDYHESRRLAEAAARCLRFTMEDSSSGEQVVREAEHLDESFAARMRRLGEEIQLPTRPVELRARVAEGGAGLVIELPAAGFDGRSVMHAAVGLGFAAFAFFGFGGRLLGGSLSDPQQQPVAAVVLALALGIPVLVAGGFLLNGRRRPTRVTASRALLRVEEGRRVTEIPGDELEELTLVGRDLSELLTVLPDGSARVRPELLDTPEAAARIGRGGAPPTLGPGVAKLVGFLSALAPDQRAIMARSDQITLHLGRGLGAAELTYLWAVIARAMTR